MATEGHSAAHPSCLDTSYRDTLIEDVRVYHSF
jgi:hypothetical protein